MNDDTLVPIGDLRSRVRSRLEAGRLPVAVAANLNAGYGSNQACSGCGDLITRQQVEYEMTDPRDGKLLVFHLHCHRVWQLECVDRVASIRPTPQKPQFD